MLDTYTTQVISFTNMQNADNAKYCSHRQTKHSSQNLLPCNTSTRFDSAFDQHVSCTTAFTVTLFDSAFDEHLVRAQLLLQPHNSQRMFLHNYFHKHNLIQHSINTWFLHNFFRNRTTINTCSCTTASTNTLFGSAVDYHMVLAQLLSQPHGNAQLLSQTHYLVQQSIITLFLHNWFRNRTAINTCSTKTKLLSQTH